MSELKKNLIIEKLRTSVSLILNLIILYLIDYAENLNSN